MPTPPTVTADDREAVTRAARALRAGGAVVVPTDTVYGVAALAGNESLLYTVKGRPAALPIAVLVAEAPDAGSLPPAAARLASRFWPGPLTIVVAGPAGDGTTVGLRCPDHVFVRALAAEVGPLPTTSANRHGQPTPPTAAEAAATLARPPALVVDGGSCTGVASTVVDCTGERPVVVRAGAVAEEAILAALS